MTRFIIIGGGGLGLEIYTYLIDDIQSGRVAENCILGVLDDSPQCELMRYIPDANYWGTIHDFVPDKGDRAIIAVGSVQGRRKLYRLTQERQVSLGTYVHSSAWVAYNAVLEPGVIVAPNSVVSAYAVVKTNTLLNIFSGVGHSARVGAHSVMSPYSVINGNTILGEGCFLGSRATLFPRVSLGKGCTVDAHSAVRSSVGDFKLISARPKLCILDNRLVAYNWER